MKRSTEWHSGLLLLVITCCVQVLAQAPNPKQAVIEVPFELIHGAIIVPATVNGAGPFWMMLDTGADPSIVELGTAKIAGLKIAASGQQGSGGGTSHNFSGHEHEREADFEGAKLERVAGYSVNGFIRLLQTFLVLGQQTTNTAGEGQKILQERIDLLKPLLNPTKPEPSETPLRLPPAVK